MEIYTDAVNAPAKENNMPHKPEIFDIAECAEKVRDALRMLQEQSLPGQRNGRGRKMDVMREVKGDIEKVMRLGYSPQQIADAISNGDVFKILPKSITQLMNRPSVITDPRPEQPKIQQKKRLPSLQKDDLKRNDGQKGTRRTAEYADVRPPKSSANEEWSGPRPDRD